MSTPVRPLVAFAFAVLVAAGAVGATPVSTAAADLTIAQAEAEMVRLLNVERGKAGLVPLRVDKRLSYIAKQRSTDMATRHYFSHVQPDGRSVFDYINAAGIKWYAAGEIIAWNNWSTLAGSASAARDGWMNSSGHRKIVLSTTYNYFGIGLAIDSSNGHKLWTGVFMKGPDRTGGWTKLGAYPSGTLNAEGYRYATVKWTGGDVRLQTLTAGFQKYQVQVRINDWAWKWLSTGTTATSRKLRLWRGYVYDMRIRTCDKVGNCGAWVTQHLVP